MSETRAVFERVTDPAFPVADGGHVVGSTAELREALDQAILDDRIIQTDESHQKVMDAGAAYRDDFFRREIADAQRRTH